MTRVRSAIAGRLVRLRAPAADRLGASGRIERRWAAATTRTVIWPAVVPDPDRLAAACARVAAVAEPGSFVARRISALAMADGVSPAEYLDRHAGRFVVVSRSRTRAELLDELDGRERFGLPFSFVLCSGGFALIHSHELGDGSVSGKLLESVVVGCAGGAAASVPFRIATGRDLVRGLGAAWWHRPRGVPETVAGLVRCVRRRSGGPGPAVAGPARMEVVGVPAPDVAALDRWRRVAGTPAPSMSVSLLWVVARVLAGHGYPAGPQTWQVMVNMRACSPALGGFGGNLVGRALVDVDPAGGPAPVAVRLRRRLASGELLARHVGKVAAEAARVRPGPTGSGGRVRGSGSPAGLAWSDRGRYAFGPAFRAAVTPAGARTPEAVTYMTPRRNGIGVNVGWLGGGATLVLTFGACPLGDDAIDGVVRTLNGGIAALLPEPGEVHPFDAPRPARRTPGRPAPSR